MSIRICMENLHTRRLQIGVDYICVTVAFLHTSRSAGRELFAQYVVRMSVGNTYMEYGVDTAQLTSHEYQPTLSTEFR